MEPRDPERRGGAPPPPLEGGLTYDPSDRVMVLFGSDSCTVGCGTWTYAGGSWTKLSLSPEPSYRWNEGFAEDDVDSGALLFGGENGSGNELGDTWLFSHDAWSEQSVQGSPPARFEPAMTWDASLHAVVLYGGAPCPSNCSLDTDTWAFQNGTWTEWNGTSPSLVLRTVGFAQDPATGILILVAACTSTPCVNGTLWGFGPTHAVSVTVETGACANLVLAGSTLTSGLATGVQNGTYSFRIAACPGFQVANVTESPLLSLNFTVQNETLWVGSLRVDGAGTILVNLTQTASGSSPTGLAAISILGLTFLELLLILVALAAVGGLFVALHLSSRRRTRRPPEGDAVTDGNPAAAGPTFGGRPPRY
ncbi:MAG: hypothetical protein L3K02_04735 [Thermoplasmata archaeon]|nr:hypothetical protein [Thermoplasmata archaeon]